MTVYVVMGLSSESDSWAVACYTEHEIARQHADLAESAVTEYDDLYAESDCPPEILNPWDPHTYLGFDEMCEYYVLEGNMYTDLAHFKLQQG